MRTYETRLPIDQKSDTLLLKFADLFARVEHKLFQAYCRGEKLSGLKNSYLSLYHITARHFNAVRIILEGKITTLIEKRKDQKKELSYRIQALRENISTKKNKFVLHQKKRKLFHLEQKLKSFEKKKNSLTFGSNKLFHAQFALKENGYSSHDEWKGDWQSKRRSQIFFIGSKDETSGNQSCTLFLREDQTFDLRIRLPEALDSEKYLTLTRIDFSYGKQEVLEALERKEAISFRLLRDEKGWRIFASFEEAKKEPVTSPENGAIGIDINVDHIAVVELDRFGNPIYKKSYPYLIHSKSKHQIRAQIGDITKEITSHAREKRKPLVIEALDFTKKRAALKIQGPKLARKLSSFTYSSFKTHLHSRAGKEGVTVNEVNPAYTSIIGKVKFSYRYGLSIHHGAALTIGRRYFGYSERSTSSQGMIPDGKGSYVALSLPARNRDEHVWRFWSKLNKKIPAALTAHFRTAKRRSTDTIKTGCVTEDLSEVGGETPPCESLEELLV